MERKHFDFILIVCFILLMVAFGAFYFFYKSEAGACLNDPLGYAQDLTNTSCTCYGGVFDSPIVYQANDELKVWDYPK